MIKIFFILNRKVTPQKNRCVGCWLLALPRAQMTRLSRILGVWFTYYVPVLINFMTPSKHLSIAYQGINLRHLLRFFFLSKVPHEKQTHQAVNKAKYNRCRELGVLPSFRVRTFWKHMNIGVLMIFEGNLRSVGDFKGKKGFHDV